MGGCSLCWQQQKKPVQQENSEQKISSFFYMNGIQQGSNINPSATSQQQAQGNSMMQTPALPSKEQLRELYKRIEQMKNEGREGEPEYQKLSKIFKIYLLMYQQMSQQVPTQPTYPNTGVSASLPQLTVPAAVPAAVTPAPVHPPQIPAIPPALTQKQKDQLKAQIYAFKFHIQKKTPIPDCLLQAIRGENTEFTLKEYERSHLSSDSTSLPSTQQQQQQPQMVSQTQMQQGLSQRSQAIKAQQRYQQAQQHVLTNGTVTGAYHAGGVGTDLMTKPSSIDFLSLSREREVRISINIKRRFDELKVIIRTGSKQEKTRAVIEMKQLQLLKFQKELRNNIIQEKKALSDNIGADRNRNRMQQPKPRIDKPRNTKYKRFLSEVTNATRKRYKEYHKSQKQKVVDKLNKELLQHFDRKAKAEKERREKQERARLKALKENNEEAYIKLLKEAKVDRLTELIKQTDECLKQLGAQLVSERDSTEEITGDGGSSEAFALDGDDQEIVPEKDSMDIYTEFIKNQKAYYKIAHTYREKVETQPTMLKGGDLKPYQLQGLQWLVSLYNNKLNGILADEMGLGKTIQTISLITYLMEYKNNNGPHLVVVPLSTIENWNLEFEKWSPEIKVIKYGGKLPERKKLQQTVLKDKSFNVLLTQYEYISRDKKILKKIHWDYIVIDEGHRIKNANCKLVSDLCLYKSKHRLLLTGTPLQNDLKELWSLLHFLLPKIFDSMTNFEAWFNTPFQNVAPEKITMDEEETLLIISRLHQVLRPFLLRREKSDVETQLPEKVEKLIRCDLSAMQKRMYRQIQEGSRILLSEDQMVKSKSLNNSVMQLRKVCNHPFLFLNDWTAFSDMDLIRSSGKFLFLDRMLPKMKASGHRVLLFSQMTQLLNILEVYLNFRGHKFVRLDGNVRAEDRGQLVKEFNSPNSPYFIFLLSTRSGGLGLNLQTADTVVIFDSDWNPQQDLQAMARAHRIGQTKSVRVFTLVTATEVEEKIHRRAQEKRQAEAKVIQAGKFNQKSTYKERQELLSLLIKREDEFEQFEIPNDEQVNDMLARSAEELELFSKMDMEQESEEAEYWKTLNKPVPQRLLSEEEIPDWMPSEDDTQALEQIEDSMGRGMRNRGKKVIYNYDIEELVVNEENDDDEADDSADYEADNKKKRKRRKQEGAETVNMKMEDDENSRKDDDTEQDDDEDTGVNRKSKRQRKSAGVTSSEIESATTPISRQKKGSQKSTKRSSKKSKVKAHPLTPTAVCGTLSFEDVENELSAPLQKKLFFILRSLVEMKDENGRYISELFLQLPDPVAYADYYEIIKHPICFEIMEKNIRSNSYPDITVFQNDLNLLVRNAQTYNQEGSQVYIDSVQLMNKFHHLIQLTSQQNNPLSFSLQSSQNKQNNSSILNRDEVKTEDSSKLANEDANVVTPPAMEADFDTFTRANDSMFDDASDPFGLANNSFENATGENTPPPF